MKATIWATQTMGYPADHPRVRRTDEDVDWDTWRSRIEPAMRETTYRVDRTQNTRLPAVGDRLSGDEVDALIARGVTVNIKGEDR